MTWTLFWPLPVDVRCCRHPVQPFRRPCAGPEPQPSELTSVQRLAHHATPQPAHAGRKPVHHHVKRQLHGTRQVGVAGHRRNERDHRHGRSSIQFSYMYLFCGSAYLGRWEKLNLKCEKNDWILLPSTLLSSQNFSMVWIQYELILTLLSWGFSSISNQAQADIEHFKTLKAISQTLLKKKQYVQYKLLKHRTFTCFSRSDFVIVNMHTKNDKPITHVIITEQSN